MKRLSLALAASLIGVAPTVGAVDLLTTFTINSSIASRGLTGQGGNEVRELTIPAGSTVTGFGWDLELQTLGGSWFSEMQVVFGANNFILEPAFWDNDENGTRSDVTLPFSSGSTRTATLAICSEAPPVSGKFICSIDSLGGTPFTIGPDGKLRMEFSESFDDETGADAYWLSGSTLTVRTTPASPVPEPGTYGLMALGMLGIAAAVWRRRA